MSDKDERKKWILGLAAVGLAIDLLLVGYVLYLLRGRMPGSEQATALSNPMQTSIELWGAYGQARAAAQAQAEDVQLVSASTQWQAVSEEALLGGSTHWSFVFYSPKDGNSIDVTVNVDTAQVVNQTRVWVSPAALAEGTWQAGPREALLVFLAYGGREFLDEHPQAMVDLHLADDETEAAWTVVALDPEDRSLFSLLIDAGTYQVLSD